MPARECSRTACSRPAVSTLTYVYADSTAVLGPLSRSSEPHTYDLCREHSAGLTAPRGWRVIRVPGAGDGADDLVALAAAVRPLPPVPGTAGPQAVRPRAVRTGPGRPGEGPASDHPASSADPGSEDHRPEDPASAGPRGSGAARTASNGRRLQAVRQESDPPSDPADGHGPGATAAGKSEDR